MPNVYSNGFSYGMPSSWWQAPNGGPLGSVPPTRIENNNRLNGNPPALGGGPPAWEQLLGYGTRNTSLTDFADSRGGSPFRDQQQQLADLLMGQAQGKDSLSAEQLRQSMGRNMAAQQSAVASASPANAALAMRTGMQNMGNLGAQLAGQQAMAGIAERQGAAQGLGALLGQGRGQDTEAYLGAMGLANQNAGMQQQGGISYGNQQAQIQSAQANRPPGWVSALGAAGGVLGLGATLSDERAKAGMRSGDKGADSLLAALAPKSFHYDVKAQKDGGGALPPEPDKDRVGVVAQAVEKAAPGSVKDTDAGKVVDFAALAPAVAAGVGRLHERVSALEAALMGKIRELGRASYKGPALNNSLGSRVDDVLGRSPLGASPSMAGVRRAAAASYLAALEERRREAAAAAQYAQTYNDSRRTLGMPSALDAAMQRERAASVARSLGEVLSGPTPRTPRPAVYPWRR